MTGALLEFVSISAWTFVLIGLAILLLISLHLYTIVLIIRYFRRLIRAERARIEIENRERRNLRRMIRNKASQEEWLRFLAGLEEDQP